MDELKLSKSRSWPLCGLFDTEPATVPSFGTEKCMIVLSVSQFRSTFIHCCIISL